MNVSDEVLKEFACLNGAVIYDGDVVAMARELIALRAAAKFPEGWKLVPVEPTQEMHHAARDWSYKKYSNAIGKEASDGCYKAMIAAAPEPSK